MTQEEKDLILKDLCARLPYGVKFLRESWNYEWDQEMSVIEVLEDIDKDGYINNTKVYKVEDVKPFLFPLSSMTEEQKSILSLCNAFIEPRSIELKLNFYNEQHIDYRGLIKKGLAIDATNLNIY